MSFFPLPHPHSQLLLPSPLPPAKTETHVRTLTHLRTPAPRPAGGTLEVKGDWRRGGQCAESGAQVTVAPSQANLREPGTTPPPRPRNSPRPFGPIRPLALTQMMRLSHSGSSDCGSGCVTSMARTAVDYTADADTSLLPALPQEPASRTCSPTRKAQ